jgi:hypothetical protein
MLSRFTLGDTLSLTQTLADYPATAGWVLNYRLLPRTGAGSAVSFASVASGSAHQVTVAKATTAAWAAGTYTWASWVTDGTSSFSVDHGTTELLADPRTAAAPLDLRSAAQIALDNVRATIEGKATSDVLKYVINGRQLEHYPMSELIALETRLAGRVAAERRTAALAAGKADPRRYSVVLGRA